MRKPRITSSRASRLLGVAIRRPAYALVVLVASLSMVWAVSRTIYGGGTQYSQAEVTQMFANSSNPYLSQNASLFGQVSAVESAGTFNTGVYNGSCCTGLMQFNNENVQKFGGVNTRQEFAQLSGQQQIDAYGKYFDRVSQESGAKRLMQMQANGESLGGRPVDGATLAGCVQFGNKNCNAAINNNCSSKENGSGGDGYLSVCGFGEKVRGQKSEANPGKNGDNKAAPSGCTTPTDPKEPSKPGNIGAGDGSTNTTGVAAAAATTPGSGGSGSATTPGSDGTPSKSEPCKQAEKKAKDTTSKTCQPTMQMINGINCSNFTGQVASFCQQYKPKLMTSDECTRAEKMAEKEKKGDRETECSNQTFATPGTSSWSYVLACSKTQANQGTFGSATQASNGSTGSSGGSTGGTSTTTGSGQAQDPQCVERLKKRVPDLKVLGAITSSGNGRTCGTKSAVSFTSASGVSVGNSIVTECTMAEKFVDFIDAMKAKGVTRMTNYGSLDRTCRPIRNSSGSHAGTMTLHASGFAIDINAFYVGGTLWDTSKYWKDPSVKAWMESNVRGTACGIFQGVLGPNFYQHSYHHYHFQITQTTRCDQPPR